MTVKPKILIVEDEPDIRDILKIFVKSLDYEPLLAEDGRQGLEVALSQHIDVVISDLMMPHASGMMMLDDLRRSGFSNPFIFVTAYPSQQASIQALRLGAFDFLEKPFDGAQVRKLLKEAVHVARNGNSIKQISRSGKESALAICDSARGKKFDSTQRMEMNTEMVRVFVMEVIKQVPIWEKSLQGLSNVTAQKWEVGYLMRAMLDIRSAASKLELDNISKIAGELEWLAMRLRLDPDLITSAAVEEFERGFLMLKTLCKEYTSLAKPA